MGKRKQDKPVRASKRGAKGQDSGAVRASTPKDRPTAARSRADAPAAARADTYRHPTADAAMRPEVGTQAEFRKKKAPATYRYDSSLAPELQWDGNPAREEGEALIKKIMEAGSLEEAKAAAERLARLGRPFLNWAGKAERLSFDVPTLPLFVHERLSTRAILESVRRHKVDQQVDAFDLFGDPKHDVADQVLRAYEHRDEWVNRMILGDSLVVMNSLLHYEGLGGQVQMIYIDPPYGVKFGSNFQPFVRKRDVKHNDDADMTREPEMVQAYRDTWELGLHSYLTYLRDRLLLASELLTPSGSVFVQISDENLHHVREVLDETFGRANFCAVIPFRKTGGLRSKLLDSITDYLLWYAKDASEIKYRQLYGQKRPGDEGATQYRYRVANGSLEEVKDDLKSVPAEKLCTHGDLTSQGNPITEYTFEGRAYRGGWKTTNPAGLDQLARAGRIVAMGNSLRYVRFLSDFPVFPITQLWGDTGISGFASQKLYVVQTSPSVVERCMLMTTDPGDLVLDPTCGSGTSSYVAEQWGRRWITIDTSRVPLALARQRLLTATFSWYQLKDDTRGPAGGFSYAREQSSKGEEMGGIVPRITLKSIANDEPPSEEVLVDRPETTKGVVRVTGPFCVEATIPMPVDWEGDGEDDSGGRIAEQHGSFVERMLEVLRRSPLLQLGGNRTAKLEQVRPPARALSLSAEALVDGKPVAIVFGPENGAVSEKLIFEAAREANMKGTYVQLFVIGFGIEPNARELVEQSAKRGSIPATYVQATPDLVMGDLLKNMRSSQIFSVCGLPEVDVRPAKADSDGAPRFQAELLGLDIFDPVEMDVEHRKGSDVPCWLLDTDYNDLCFRVSQAFFPKTGAWDNLRKALKADYEEAVWDHLAGTTSAPFHAPPGKNEFKVAVKVIDERGNELLVVREVNTGVAKSNGKKSAR